MALVSSRRFHAAIPVLLACLSLPAAHGGGDDFSDDVTTADYGSKVASLEINDSLQVSLDVFFYLSQSQGEGWNPGEPLGAGGKAPVAYDLSLYRE